MNIRRSIAALLLLPLLVALIGVGPARAATLFVDVPPGAQFEREIGWAADRGITTGWQTPADPGTATTADLPADLAC